MQNVKAGLGHKYQLTPQEIGHSPRSHHAVGGTQIS